MNRILICAAALFFLPASGFAQGYIPSCPPGSHIVIYDSEALSSLYSQAEQLDGLSESLHKKQQNAKTDSEAALNSQAADEADQTKSTVVSAYLGEQVKNMRCVADR